ncbi:ABC transporter permease [Brachybacterium hainanense]|uniref:ABC transporter permease n=1 Tax=Brachybacterium hainanense TaxID=1541174 RepID=A0ABV6REX6_9MICO
MAEQGASPQGTSTLRMVRTLYGSRIRAQLSYRANFATDAASQALMSAIEFLELWVILGHVDTFGGLTLVQVMVVFGLASAAFAIADLAFGEIDGLSTYIRTGKLETLMIRPVPLLLQISSLDLSLRRIGRLAVGLAMYVTALVLAGFSPTPATLLLAIAAPVIGAGIFSALFVMAGALQFWLIDGREFANAFTYGGNYVAQNPASVFALPMRALFTFVIPTSLVAYAPTLVLLGLPGPRFVPSWAGWIGLPVALLAWGLALLLWRSGVRRYTGAGG